jgi:tRNA(Ile)-lysidine synthase
LRMLQNRQELINAKNLLAFSAGVDSTALLFLLLENKIPFDIAIVDYGLRSQSKEEVAYAQELAQLYHFKCHLLSAQQIDSNFEANARKIRYDFFESLIQEYHYENLLTAHHLGDRFEWMLMQFCKGAGCIELSGMSSSERRQKYTLVRPLLHLDKQELLTYLQSNNIRYFEDESNSDESYKRNEFRHNYTKPLLEKYLRGIKKSFEYIDEDVNLLLEDIEVISLNEFAYFKRSKSQRSNLVAIDRYLKSKNQLITAQEKQLLKSNKTVVLGRKFVVWQSDIYIFIAPYYEAREMSKEFREKMRLLKIEPKLRGYFWRDSEAAALLLRLFE